MTNIMQRIYPVVAPWSMCSENEALDRSSHKELSSFESTVDTYKLLPTKRIPDPSLCVKKYRRSAAGGGAQMYQDEKIRSMEQLELTVDFLMCVWSQQKSRMEMQKALFLQTVNFVDDRIRAVQVDLTKLLGGLKVNHSNIIWARVRELQATLIRYNIFTHYLLSNLNASKYEWKFAHTALTTTVSSYFSTFHHQDEHIDLKEMDEIMSYASLLHLATVIRGQESAVPSASSTGQQCGLALSDGSGISSLLSLYQKFLGDHTFSKLKKYRWVLDLASEYENGNYLVILRMLHDDDGSKWRILSRCCIAQVLPIIRIGLMRQYNKSFAKEEKVTGKDLQHLLHLPSEDIAITFCEDIGLSTTASIEGGIRDCVIMKVSPISIAEDSISKVTNPGRSEDSFVFGTMEWYKEWKELPKSAWDTESDREKKESIGTMTSLQMTLLKMDISVKTEKSNPDIRVDGDGILIPPASILKDIIQP
jgi:hypothetical protein